MSTEIRIEVPESALMILVNYFEEINENRFRIGDMLVDLVKSYQGAYYESDPAVVKAKVINHIAGKLRVAPSTLYDYYRISKRWTRQARAEFKTLDWTVYRNTDPSDPNDREIIQEVIDKQLNTTEFKDLKFEYRQNPTVILRQVRGMLARILHNGTPLENVVANRIAKIVDELEDIVGEEKDE